MYRILLSKTSVIIFFVLANLVFWGGMFFGLDFTDSFFHINAASSKIEGFYSSFFLSSVLIKFIKEFVGENLIVFRLANSLLLYFSVFLPFIIGRTSLTPRALFYISCVLVLVSPLNANILGYDTFSVFFISLLYSAFLKYLNHRKAIWCLISSALCSLAVFIRLPNIILILILFSCCFYFADKRKAFGFLLFSSFLVILGYYLVYNGYEGFVDSLYGTKSHSLPNLMLGYLTDAIRLFFYVLFIISIRFIYKGLKNIKYEYRLILVVSSLALFILYFVSFSGYWKNYSLFLTAFTITWGGITIYEKSFEGLTESGTHILLFLTLLFVIPFGSNTGLLKASFLFVLFPFVFTQIKASENAFWKLIIIILIPFALIEKFSSTYEDAGILKLVTSPSLNKLEPIITTEARKEYLQSINKKVDSLEQRGYEFVFYGNKSHIFNYIYPSEIRSHNFYQPLNELSLFKRLNNRKGENKIAVFLIDNYPEVNGGLSNTPVGKELKNQGFNKLKSGNVVYYVKD